MFGVMYVLARKIEGKKHTNPKILEQKYKKIYLKNKSAGLPNSYLIYKFIPIFILYYFYFIFLFCSSTAYEERLEHELPMLLASA